MTLTADQKQENKIEKWRKKYVAAGIQKTFSGKPGTYFGLAQTYQFLRRLESADENGACRCISCGKVRPFNEMHGGHYRSRKDYVTCVDLGFGLIPNVNVQCPHCNKYLEGNRLAYRAALVSVHSEQRVVELESVELPLDWIWDYRKLAEIKCDMDERIKVEKARLGV